MVRTRSQALLSEEALHGTHRDEVVPDMYALSPVRSPLRGGGRRESDLSDSFDNEKAQFVSTQSPIPTQLPVAQVLPYMELPLLDVPTSLIEHLELCEEMLAEDSIDSNSHRGRSKILVSLKNCSEVYSMASQLRRGSYEEFRQTLIDCFASPRLVRAEYNRQLGLLNFDWSRGLSFTNQVRTLYALYQKSSTCVNNQEFLSRILAKLPAALAERLMETLVTRSGEDHWASHFSVPAILKELHNKIANRLSVEEFLPRPASQPGSRTRDTVAYTSPPTGQNGNGDWIEDWVKQFANVIVLLDLTQLDSVKPLCRDVKMFRQRSYCFLGLETDAAYRRVCSVLPKGKWRDFVSRPRGVPKN